MTRQLKAATVEAGLGPAQHPQMKITRIVSHVLQYDMPEELGYSQQFYSKRTAHIVEVETDEGITGWGECFGPGTVALANRAIVEQVIQPMVLGMDPLDRDPIWHRVYNLLRDHGQKGMPLQALSGVDIALWDIAGKVAGLPIHKLIGGAHRQSVPVYGYGMMLRREDAASLAARFADEAAAIKAMGFVAAKMKVGLGPQHDVVLAEAVRRGVGDDFDFMVDANHCYTAADAFHVGRALDELGAFWFEEPVAPEDLDGYAALRAGLRVNIAGGEAEFSRWGWRTLLESPRPRHRPAGGLLAGRNQRIPPGSRALPRAFHAGGESCLGLGHRCRRKPATVGGDAAAAGRPPPARAHAGVRYDREQVSRRPADPSAEHPGAGRAQRGPRRDPRRPRASASSRTGISCGTTRCDGGVSSNGCRANLPPPGRASAPAVDPGPVDADVERILAEVAEPLERLGPPREEAVPVRPGTPDRPPRRISTRSR